jgi:LEA14-like dessication related protein
MMPVDTTQEIFMPQTTLRTLLALLLLLCVAGCAGLGKRPSPPQVALADIRVQEVKLFETVFLVQLRVFNPNDLTLPLEGIEADLELNGRPFARGVGRSKSRIAPYATELVTMEIYSSSMGMVGALFDVMEDRKAAHDAVTTLSYRLRANCTSAGSA